MEELIVLTKSTKISFNLYLFLILSVILSVFAGADPEEVTLEEEMQSKEVKKDIVKYKILCKLNH